MAGFIFGAGTPYSYEDLQKQRAIAERLAEATAAGSNARTVPEGLLNLGTGIMAGLMKRRADKTAAKGKSDYDSRFNSITKSLLGGGKASGSRSNVSASASADVVSGIKATAESLGIDPVDLATAISYETAGTFDPMKKGPTTKWGQHKGLIQFGEPQAAKYGVDWNNPVGSQLGPQGAVAQYLRDTGVKPGMGLLDIYSAINAGGVGRYNRSDAHAGGAPGTVADKMRDQMSGHRAKAMALLGGGASPAVASAPQAAPMPNGMQIMPVSAPVEPQIMPASAPAMARPATAFQRAELARLENEVGVPRQQMDARRQAILGQQGGNAQPSGGGFFTNMVPTSGSPEQMAQVQQAEMALEAMPIEQIAELASSPFAEPWQKNLMQQYLQHRMEQQFAAPPDPLDQRLKELEVQKLEQGLQPAPKGRPATAEEKRAFGLPETAPVFIKPDGTPELLDVSKLGMQPGFRPATPEEKQTFGVGADVPLVIGPNGKPDILSDGKTTVNMGGGSDKQIFDETKARADAARAARTGLSAITEAQRALPGAITGAAANERLALQKVASLFGVGDTRAIADTETFRSAIAPQVAAMLKATVGSAQISNADREFAEKAAGGAITLDASSIQRLMNIMRAANSEIVRGFNADLDRVYPEGQGFDRERALFNVPQSPKFYSEPIGPQIPGATAPQEGRLVDPSNPQPGGYELGVEQIPENVQVEGEDGNVYMKRNGKLWRKSPNNDWEAVQ